MPLEINITKRLSNHRTYPLNQPGKSIIIAEHSNTLTLAAYIKWVKQTPDNISANYAIDRDGIVYELIPPQRWSKTLGQPNKRVFDTESQVVTIIFIAGGKLYKTKRGFNFYADLSNKKKYTLIPREQVWVMDPLWKNHKYYHNYNENQLLAFIDLLDLVKTQFNLEYELPTAEIFHGYNPDFNKSAVGIFSRTVVTDFKDDCPPHEEFDIILEPLPPEIMARLLALNVYEVPTRADKTTNGSTYIYSGTGSAILDSGISTYIGPPSIAGIGINVCGYWDRSDDTVYYKAFSVHDTDNGKLTKHSILDLSTPLLEVVITHKVDYMVVTSGQIYIFDKSTGNCYRYLKSDLSFIDSFGYSGYVNGDILQVEYSKMGDRIWFIDESSLNTLFYIDGNTTTITTLYGVVEELYFGAIDTFNAISIDQTNNSILLLFKAAGNVRGMIKLLGADSISPTLHSYFATDAVIMNDAYFVDRAIYNNGSQVFIIMHSILQNERYVFRFDCSGSLTQLSAVGTNIMIDGYLVAASEDNMFTASPTQISSYSNGILDMVMITEIMDIPVGLSTSKIGRLDIVNR